MMPISSRNKRGLATRAFVPYIFTHDEMKAVIKAADDTEPCGMAKNMHLSLPVIFRILYGCGLRVSEVVKLRYEDVNLKEENLTIREAKTDRDRLIPCPTPYERPVLPILKKSGGKRIMPSFSPRRTGQ